MRTGADANRDVFAMRAEFSRPFRSKRDGKPIAPTMRMTTNHERTLVLQNRSFELTCNVINAFPRKGIEDASRIIWRQLLRAVSSSTFNLEEAHAACSDADFLAKMRVALREARETRVAIRLIVACKLLAYASVSPFEDEARQMSAILATIIVNKKASMQRPRF